MFHALLFPLKALIIASIMACAGTGAFLHGSLRSLVQKRMGGLAPKLFHAREKSEKVNWWQQNVNKVYEWDNINTFCLLKAVRVGKISA